VSNIQNRSLITPKLDNERLRRIARR